MLVLARRQNEKLVFPNLGISVHVVRVDGRTVRLGIEAPRDVRVLREELAGEEPRPAASEPPSAVGEKLNHAMRNRIHAATVGLHLLRRQVETGRLDNAEPTIGRILQELERLESFVGATKTPSAASLARGDRHRALLVEDNDNEAELLAGFLRTFEFDVERASDGQAALDFLESNKRPDLVLLDMNMPRKNGAATIRAMRRNPALEGLKVFAVSGLQPQQAGVEVGPRGVDRWFRKPVKPDELVREMHRELAV